MKTFHVIFKGRVQGVNFRGHVKECCDALGVVGTVRNKLNLDVEAFFQTDQTTFERLIEKIQKTAHRWIDIKEFEWDIVESSKDYSSFEIIR